MRHPQVSLLAEDPRPTMPTNAISKTLAAYSEGPFTPTLKLEQRSCWVSAAVQAALFIPVLTLVVAPFAMVAAEAIAEPAARERLTGAPLNSAAALVGVIVWIAMFGRPAISSLGRLNWRRAVTVAHGVVSVEDVSLFGRRTWSQPLSAYCGVSHHVRTSLSGTRHEIVLVHPERRACVLLQMSDTIGSEEAEALAQRLGVAHLEAGALFRRQQPAPAAFAEQPVLAAQAA